MMACEHIKCEPLSENHLDLMPANQHIPSEEYENGVQMLEEVKSVITEPEGITIYPSVASMGQQDGGRQDRSEFSANLKEIKTEPENYAYQVMIGNPSCSTDLISVNDFDLKYKVEDELWHEQTSDEFMTLKEEGEICNKQSKIAGTSVSQRLPGYYETVTKERLPDSIEQVTANLQGQISDEVSNYASKTILNNKRLMGRAHKGKNRTKPRNKKASCASETSKKRKEGKFRQNRRRYKTKPRDKSVKARGKKVVVDHSSEYNVQDTVSIEQTTPTNSESLFPYISNRRLKSSHQHLNKPSPPTCGKGRSAIKNRRSDNRSDLKKESKSQQKMNSDWSESGSGDKWNLETVKSKSQTKKTSKSSKGLSCTGDDVQRNLQTENLTTSVPCTKMTVSSHQIGTDQNMLVDTEPENQNDPEHQMYVHSQTLDPCKPTLQSELWKTTFPYYCIMCRWGFRTLDQLKEHMTTHGTTLEKPLKCAQCNEIHSSVSTHINKHYASKPKNLCKICCIVLEPQHKVRHQENHRPQFGCITCGQRFPLVSALREHLREEGHEPDNKCPSCNFIGTRPTALKEHMEGHVNKVLFKCDQCPFATSSRAFLNTHKFTHTRVKDKKCPHCDMYFITNKRVKQHIRGTHEEKSFVCSVCGAAFAFSRWLRYHMTTHGEKNLSCSYCGKKFALNFRLRNHVREKHEKVQSHQCEICGETMISYSALKMHKVKHGDLSPFTCAFCEKTFKRRQNLKSHMKTHSDERKYECQLCGDAFKWKHNLESHMKKHPD